MTAMQTIRRPATLGAALVLLIAAALTPFDAEAQVHTAGHTLVWEKITDGPGRFLNYDGAQDFSYHHRDWPIGLLFYRDASIRKVKDQLDLSSGGSPMHEGVRYTRTSSRRFDADSGRKTSCGDPSKDTLAHYRVYAPDPAGDVAERLYDERYGFFVVGSAHFDHGKTECGDSRRWHGFSEEAEYRIGSIADNVSGWSLRRNYIKLHNQEDFRKDTRSPTHYWKNDGRATAVRVP